MRMWMVDPKYLCKKHLLGEHVECHMFVGTILKNKSLKGYKKNKLVEVHNLKKRHNQLVEEMIRRGMNHQSPLKEFEEFEYGEVDKIENLKELTKRCSRCKELIEGEVDVYM